MKLTKRQLKEIIREEIQLLEIKLNKTRGNEVLNIIDVGINNDRDLEAFLSSLIPKDLRSAAFVKFGRNTAMKMSLEGLIKKFMVS